MFDRYWYCSSVAPSGILTGPNWAAAGKRGDLGAGLAQPGGGAIQLGTVSRAQDQTAAAPGQFGSEQQP
jgi:hypothetical protein